MEAKLAKNIRILVVITTIILATLIFSFTFGKNLVNGQDLSLESFALLHFSGYLFFLLMPVELAFTYCITNGYNMFLLIGIAFSTAIAAQMIDYLIGYSVSAKFLSHLVNPKKHARAIRIINKYGSLTIFIFNLLPLSSPIICLASGAINYPFRKVVTFSALGLLMKYFILAWIFLK